MMNFCRFSPRPLPSLGLLFSTIGLVSGSIAQAQTSTPLFPVTPEIGPPAIFSVLADFNGDGKLDLASWQGGTSTVLSVTLDVAGSTPTTINTPVCESVNPASPFAVGDLNNDKKPDVVMSCAGYTAVLFGKGDGSFHAPVYYPTVGVGTPTLVDLNGDGYLDVAILEALRADSLATLSVYLNEGDAAPGTLGAPSVNSTNTPASLIFELVSGDFNGDGKQDLLILGNALTSGYLTVLYGNGDGTLQAAQTQTLPSGLSLTGTVALGDFNHDGTTDVAYLSVSECCVVGVPATSIQIVLGSSNGTFAKGAALPIQPNSYAWSLAAAQFTNDGNLDLVASGNAITTVFRGDGKGGFTQGESYAASGVPLVGDLNGNGKPDLLLQTGGTPTGAGLYLLYGNGDGTFQGVPTVPTNTNGNMVYADLNGDGIADAVYQTSALDANGDSSIVSALGRGDGTFAILNQAIPLSGNGASPLVMGDFNGDGKPDLAVVTGNLTCPAPSGNSGTLSIYPGNGNGTFGTAISVTGLPAAAGASTPVVGDFNGDGKLDLVIPYGYSCTDEYPLPPGGLIFVPGNGDGTLGTPVYFSTGTYGTNLFASDLNKDGKLDLVWQGISLSPGPPPSGTVYLGNGDGTFKQQPINLSGSATGRLIWLSDLNGDGYPDLMSEPGLYGNLVIYAGNGDGTFQTNPFYTVQLPAETAVETASVGDVNGDDNPDIVVMYSGLQAATGAQISVFLGNGKGDFAVDSNTYFAGTPNDGIGSPNIYDRTSMALVRVNNQAPALSSDTTLDILANTSFGLTSLLNQKNPPPTTPTLFSSTTTLQASTTSGNLNVQITLTATVSGVNPTGSVTFVAGSTTLGTATLANGVAMLQTSFAAAGSYSVIANYSGDANNAQSASGTVMITIIAPDFTIAANPQNLTIQAGQSGTVTLTLTPAGGYTGTVNLSCTGLPSEASCTFSPSALTPSGNSAVTGQLTISTTAASSASLGNHQPANIPWIPTGTLALAGLVGLAISPARNRRWNSRLRVMSMLLILTAGWISLQGCGGGGNSGTKNAGTPPGTYAINVTAGGSNSEAQHSVALNVTVQ